LIVIDASAVLELLLDARNADQIAKYLGSDELALAAPHLIDLEIAQVLRRYVRSGAMTLERASEVLSDWRDFPITRYPHNDLLSRVFELRDNSTAYDSVYLALAEALDASLITHDQKMRSIPGHGVKVIVV
jgi:predicted nucleic acid-binding protein